MRDYINVAIDIAKDAGQYLLTQRGKIKDENIDEKAENDFVTYVDKKAEEIIVDALLKNFPSHKIIAEESLHQQTHDEYRWIVDPLDGTKNFIHNLPFFSISIALEFNKEILAGVVYNPVHNEIFAAEKCSGAYFNDIVMKVSDKKFSQSLLATGFPYRNKDELPKYLKIFEEILLNCSGIRRLGSAAIDLSYTALGNFDGFWEYGLSIWDLAAGSLFVQEAGGIVTDFWGSNNYLKNGCIVAGNKTIHERLIKIIKSYYPA